MSKENTFSEIPTKEEIVAESNKYMHWQRAGEVGLAFGIAKSRERFRWALGYTTALCIGASTKWMFSLKFPLIMLLPISASLTYTAWEYDLGYGDKLNRVNNEAHKILNHTSNLCF
jgi:hypothetical protein